MNDFGDNAVGRYVSDLLCVFAEYHPSLRASIAHGDTEIPDGIILTVENRGVWPRPSYSIRVVKTVSEIHRSDQYLSQSVFDLVVNRFRDAGILDPS